MRRFGLDALSADIPVVVFDELHKYPRWKSFLKGFFDVYGRAPRISGGIFGTFCPSGLLFAHRSRGRAGTDTVFPTGVAGERRRSGIGGFESVRKHGAAFAHFVRLDRLRHRPRRTDYENEFLAARNRRV